MQTTKIFKFFRHVLAAAGIAFISCIIARAQAQDASTAASATASSALPLKVDSDLSGISMELTSVQKTGDTIMIRFKYISTRDKPTRIDNEAGQQVSDMYYVDAKNKKKYPIIKDTESKPLSSNLVYFEVAAGETKAGWAKFPAPPPDVTAISVYIPGAPPFENVPIAQ
jgi:hypothetical protein